MTHRQAKKIWNYYCVTNLESHPNVYLIHLIDANDSVFNVINIEYLQDAFRFTFSQGEEVFQLWEEEIDESQIFVFKQINWNKL